MDEQTTYEYVLGREVRKVNEHEMRVQEELQECVCGRKFKMSSFNVHKSHCLQWKSHIVSIAASPETRRMLGERSLIQTAAELGIAPQTLRKHLPAPYVRFRHEQNESYKASVDIISEDPEISREEYVLALKKAGFELPPTTARDRFAHIRKKLGLTGKPTRRPPRDFQRMGGAYPGVGVLVERYIREDNAISCREIHGRLLQQGKQIPLGKLKPMFASARIMLDLTGKPTRAKGFRVHEEPSGRARGRPRTTKDSEAVAKTKPAKPPLAKEIVLSPSKSWNDIKAIVHDNDRLMEENARLLAENDGLRAECSQLKGELLSAKVELKKAKEGSSEEVRYRLALQQGEIGGPNGTPTAHSRR